MLYRSLKKIDLAFPPIIFGVSSLGNLYQELPYSIKLDILREIFAHIDGCVALDAAGKYGAGLALEVIGQGLVDLGIPPERLLLSNKLGWYRVPLSTPAPTFEPGVWMGIDHDAVQKISADGILECWEQGCRLLGGRYQPQLLSVHDADEYLAAADSPEAEKRRMKDILDAYEALHDLKAQGKTRAVGIGAKNWRVIRDISRMIDLDWVMLAVSFTIFSHPPELTDFMDELAAKGIGIINSAVFHAGFLTGGCYFDYRLLDEHAEEDRPYFEWRARFFELCARFHVAPATACIQFGLSHPAVLSVALNTSKPDRIRGNIESITDSIAAPFWQACKAEGLIQHHYPYLGS